MKKFLLLLPLIFTACEISLQTESKTGAGLNPVAQGCVGDEIGSRVRYQSESVPAGSSCVSETQIRSCVDASFSDFSGSFDHVSCKVEESPGDDDQGTVYSNEVIKIETPSSLVAGQEATIKIYYSSNTDNEIKVDLKRYSLNQMIAASGALKVTRGENNVLIVKMDVPSTGAENTNDSRFLVYMFPETKGWADKYHQLWSASLDLSAQPSTPVSGTELCGSITRGAITWTFDRDDYVCGQYANDDWFVVGPVTINNISPASVNSPRTMHGSMLNPVAGVSVKQGFDSDNDVHYDVALNVGRPGGNAIGAGNPLVVASGSLLSSKSITTSNQRPQLREIQILTVVTAAPQQLSFRPPYAGSDKTHHWKKSDLDYSALLSLAPVGSTPDLTTLASRFEKPWIEINTQYMGRDIHPSNNQPDYGREISYLINDALLSLHLNYSNEQKEALLIRIVQYGIDIYGAAINGAKWETGGGHNQGRKAPMLFAGRLLNDPHILARGNRANYNIFQCDLQLFYVSQSDVDRERYTSDGRPRAPYTTDMIGMPEWGEQHNRQPQRDGSNWGAYYRNIANSALVGGVLAIKLMRLESAWNNPVVFDYMENRYVPIELPRASNLTNRFQLFHANMWSAYYGQH